MKFNLDFTPEELGHLIQALTPYHRKIVGDISYWGEYLKDAPEEERDKEVDEYRSKAQFVQSLLLKLRRLRYAS